MSGRLLRSTLLLAITALAGCGSTSGSTSLGRLNWGLDSTGAPWTATALLTGKGHAPATTAKVVQSARDTVAEPLKVVAAFHLQGVLSSDPAYKESSAAARQLRDVYAWAMCARVAQGSLGEECRTRAVVATQAWVGTYRPTGAPIDEANLIPLFQAIDLLGDEQRKASTGWLREALRQNDAYYARLALTSASRTNNQASWSFALRAIEARLLGDPAEQATSRQLLHDQIARNVRPDGSTLDFVQRDALHYQAYDSDALMQALLLAPASLSADDEAAVLTSIVFLQPFVTGQQQHLEFVGSRVAFDAQRREAGDPTFANAPWQPSDARDLLLLAGAHFPSIRSWASSVAPVGCCGPRLEQLAALYSAS